MARWFHESIIDTGRLPLFVLFAAFLATFLFIRFSVRMIRAEVRWWPGNITPGGLHVHHVVFGLVAMLVAGVGFVALADYHTPVAHCVFAGLFGIGSALVLDEFALVLYLRDVYWAEQGRLSVDAVFVAVAVIALLTLGLHPFGIGDGDYAGDQGLVDYAVSTAAIVVAVILTVITMLKGKFWTGLLGPFLPVLVVVGALRLARPGSPWARWRYRTRPRRMARAQQREARYREPVVRAKIAVQEAVGGSVGMPPAQEPPAPGPTSPAHDGPPAGRRSVHSRVATAIEWRQTRRRLRAVPLWRVPAVLVALAVVLGLVLAAVDDSVAGQGGVGIDGLDAGATATMLSVIAGGMITLSGLVFTALTLAMQFGASQLSVRVVPMLQQARILRWSIGVFLATFVFALIIALDLAVGGSQRVPLVSTTVGLVLTLLSTGLFIGLVARVAHVLNPTRLPAEVARQGRSAIQRTYPDGPPRSGCDDGDRGAGDRADGDDGDDGAAAGAAQVIPLRNPDPAGQVMLAVHGEKIGRLARRWGVRVTVVPAIGQFVTEGAPLFLIHGPMTRVRADVLARYVIFGDTHSPAASPAAALQSLADVALKALSPAVNDPSRAVQSFDYIEDLLAQLARRMPDAGDGRGAGRLHGSRLTWEDYVSVAVDEIRHFSGESLMVQRRLRAVLTGLLEQCPERLRGPLRERIDVLDAAVRRGMPDPLDVRLARIPDPLGLGSRRDDRG